MKNKLKILYTAFNGKDNSSKILLDKLYSNNKLYLKNSFITSVRDLQKEIENNDYDLIISFGQAPLGKDTIKIELVGKLEKAYETHYNYEKIKNLLKTKYKVIISKNAGNYLCNNLYYYGLKFISEKSLRTNMILIHIPKMPNITNIENLSTYFANFNN